MPVKRVHAEQSAAEKMEPRFIRAWNMARVQHMQRTKIAAELGISLSVLQHDLEKGDVAMRREWSDQLLDTHKVRCEVGAKTMVQLDLVTKKAWEEIKDSTAAAGTKLKFLELILRACTDRLAALGELGMLGNIEEHASNVMAKGTLQSVIPVLVKAVGEFLPEDRIPGFVARLDKLVSEQSQVIN